MLNILIEHWDSEGEAVCNSAYTSIDKAHVSPLIEPAWRFAVQTCSRHEKRAASQLTLKGVDHDLPSWPAAHTFLIMYSIGQSAFATFSSPNVFKRSASEKSGKHFAYQMMQSVVYGSQTFCCS